MVSVVLYRGLYNSEIMVVSLYLSEQSVSMARGFFSEFQKSKVLFEYSVPPPIKLRATTNLNIVESAKCNPREGFIAIHVGHNIFVMLTMVLNIILFYLEEVTTNMQIKHISLMINCLTSGDQYLRYTHDEDKITNHKLCMSKGDWSMDGSLDQEKKITLNMFYGVYLYLDNNNRWFSLE